MDCEANLVSETRNGNHCLALLRTFIALPFIDLPYPRAHHPRLQDLVRRIRSFSTLSPIGVA